MFQGYLKGKKNNLSGIIGSVLFGLTVFSILVIMLVANHLQNRTEQKQLLEYFERMEKESQTDQYNLHVALKLVKSWVQNGGMPEIDFDGLNKEIITLLQPLPQVAAISVANEHGETYSIRYDSGSWEAIKSDKNIFPKSALVQSNQGTGLKIKADSLVAFPVELDTGLIQLHTEFSDSIFHLPLQYIPGTSPLQGICFSTQAYDSLNQQRYLLKAYMSLEHIHDFIQTKQRKNQFEFVLFNLEGKILYFNKTVSDSTPNSNVNAILKPFDNIVDKPYSEAFNKWSKSSDTEPVNVFDFRYKRKQYLAAFSKDNLPNPELVVALIVPREPVLNLLKERRNLFLKAFFLILTAALLSMWVLVRIINPTRRHISRFSDADLFNLIEMGESEAVEFKSTIRMNLHSGNPGKEIELAWLKSVAAFCNTEGGHILIGISDNGSILGLEADRFSNDDKCLLHVQNLFKQHLGLEHLPSIHYYLHEIAEKKILVVECKPSSKPMFLYFNEKEQFFVRSGPASIELPVSKVIEYLSARKI